MSEKAAEKAMTIPGEIIKTVKRVTKKKSTKILIIALTLFFYFPWLGGFYEPVYLLTNPVWYLITMPVIKILFICNLFWMSIATFTASPNFCLLVIGLDKDRCIADVAMETKNLKLCDEIGDSVWENNCHIYLNDFEYCKKQNCIDGFAVFHENITVCMAHNDDQSEISCFSELTRIYKNNYSSECLKLDNKHKFNCLLAMGNAEGCALLDDYNLFKQCIISLNQPIFCANLSKSDIKECIDSYASNKYPSDLPFLMEEYVFESDYYEDLREVLFTTYSSPCDHDIKPLMDNSTGRCLCNYWAGKDHCILYYAKKWKDSSMCENIGMNEGWGYINYTQHIKNECYLYFCNYLGSDEEKQKCKDNLFSSYTEALITDYKWCPNATWSRHCSHCIEPLIERTFVSCPGSCYNKGELESEKCLCNFLSQKSIDECVLFQAQKKGDISLCNYIQNLTVKSQCLSDFG